VVLYILKWDIRPDKEKDYLKWTAGAIQRNLAAPGVVEFRAYRGATGSSPSQVVITYEFKDFANWAKWYVDAGVQQSTQEVRSYVENLSSELWGPSPVVPKPMRPKA
jgi:antibiotic biosynthesis monooxygenase (ABM) superfamily enzyme